MSNITYQEERLEGIQSDMLPLLSSHYKETDGSTGIPFDPNWESYFSLENLGLLHTITVRTGGVLVGYYLSVITPSLHSKDLLYCVNDAIYILPRYRGAGVGKGLLNFVEHTMKERGVDVMTISMKRDLGFDKLCEKLGWVYTERVYTRDLRT